jgi:hypothetical protein
MMRRLIEMLSRHPSEDERTRKAKEIEALQVKSDATLNRADGLVPNHALRRELDGAAAAFRRRR